MVLIWGVEQILSQKVSRTSFEDFYTIFLVGKRMESLSNVNERAIYSYSAFLLSAPLTLISYLLYFKTAMLDRDKFDVIFEKPVKVVSGAICLLIALIWGMFFAPLSDANGAPSKLGVILTSDLAFVYYAFVLLCFSTLFAFLILSIFGLIKKHG